MNGLLVVYLQDNEGGACGGHCADNIVLQSQKILAIWQRRICLRFFFGSALQKRKKLLSKIQKHIRRMTRAEIKANLCFETLETSRIHPGWSIIHYTDEKSEESEPPARRPPAQTRNGTTQTKAGRLPDRDRLRRPVPQGTGRPCPEHRPRPDDSRDAHPAAAAHRHGKQPQPTRPHGACGRIRTRCRHFGGVGRPN